MGSASSKLVSALLVLIIFAAGYQFITNAGNYLANEVFRIPVLNFWLISFVGLLGLGILLGIDPSKLLK